ncbi:MAG: AMP-binding protein, partial [Solirubrobacterales bacterium]
MRTRQTPEILWEPTAAAVEASNLTAYIDHLRAEGVDVAGYPDLWRWSVEDLEAFWNSIFDWFEVEYDGERTVALASREMPGAEWFPGVRLNWAERAFAGKADEEVAILHASELRDLEEISWGELGHQVAAVAGGLRSLGVEKGDRVVAYLPNIAEATIAFLAVASIGAIWSSASPDFGA